MTATTINVIYQSGPCTKTEVVPPNAVPGKMQHMAMGGEYQTDEFRGFCQSAGVISFFEAEPTTDADFRYEGQQRFTGTVLGKKGSFLARQTLVRDKGACKSHWEIIEGTGRDGLEGIAGEGSFVVGDWSGDNPPVPGTFTISVK